MRKLLIKFNNEIIDQTQGEDADLELWLSGNLHKYAKGTVAEYHDLSQDYEYLLAECLANRVSEYPQLGEFLNAHFDLNGDFSVLEAKRLEIKTKYPKPVQGESVTPVIVELFPDPVIIEEEL